MCLPNLSHVFSANTDQHKKEILNSIFENIITEIYQPKKTSNQMPVFGQSPNQENFGISFFHNVMVLKNFHYHDFWIEKDNFEHLKGVKSVTAILHPSFIHLVRLVQRHNQADLSRCSESYEDFIELALAKISGKLPEQNIPRPIIQPTESQGHHLHPHHQNHDPILRWWVPSDLYNG